MAPALGLSGSLAAGAHGFGRAVAPPAVGTWIAAKIEAQSILISRDGLNWQPAVTGLMRGMERLATGPAFVIGTEPAPSRLLRTVDGVTWTDTGLPPLSLPAGFSFLSWANNAYFARVSYGVGARSVVFRSTDGLTWNEHQYAASGLAVDHQYFPVSYANGFYFMPSTVSRYFRSSDGITWGEPANDLAGGMFNRGHPISNGSRFVGMVSFTGMRYSADALTWSPTATAFDAGYGYPLAFGAGVLVALQNNFTTSRPMWTSVDASTWSPIAPYVGPPGNVAKIVHNPLTGEWVLYGTNNDLGGLPYTAKSADLASWQIGPALSGTTMDDLTNGLVAP